MTEWLAGLLTYWLYPTNNPISNCFLVILKLQTNLPAFYLDFLCSNEHQVVFLGHRKYFGSPNYFKAFPSRSVNMCKIKVNYSYYRTKLIHYLYVKFNLMIGMEDINRLKLVLVEKKRKQESGWQNSWGGIHQQYQNGAPMFHGLIRLLFQE